MVGSPCQQACSWQHAVSGLAREAEQCTHVGMLMSRICDSESAIETHLIELSLQRTPPLQ